MPHDPDAKEMLDLAARAAFRATGHVEPNPLVGCVIVRPARAGEERLPARERVIGIGHHRRFGRPHAEVDALTRCRELGNDPRGATVYVTLEPCNGHGRNPPCVKALVEAAVGRVVCAAPDETDGKGNGSAALRAVGIPCVFTGVSQRAIDLSGPWRHRLKTPLPWVIAKWAQTIDGKLATASDDSRWISGERSRLRVHRLRSTVDAVAVGRRTFEIDNPMLTARNVPDRRGASRVLISRHPPDDEGLTLYRTAPQRKTIVLTKSSASGPFDRLPGVQVVRVDDRPDNLWLVRAITALRERCGVNTLMVEGGACLLGGLIEHGLVNEAHVHVGPVVIGDGDASPSLVWRFGIGDRSSIAGLPRWRLLGTRQVGDDVQSVYRKRD